MLKTVIEMLRAAPQDAVLRNGFFHPHSFRDFYDELAFEPAPNVPVREMLEDAEYALGHTFEGYKGGQFTMGEYTSCWLANYGEGSDDRLGPRLLAYMLADVVDAQGECCMVCGERMDSLSADPGEWALRFSVPGHGGRTQPAHVHCAVNRLVDRTPPPEAPHD